MPSPPLRCTPTRGPLCWPAMKKISGYPGCMACGRANPRGLQLDLYLLDGRVETRYRLPRTRRVSRRRARRVLCMILDEVMAWAAIEGSGRFHMTGEMSVRFLAPAVPGEEILARGEIAEDKRRFLVCRGEVLAADGRQLAKAEGKYFAVSPEAGREWRSSGDGTPSRRVSTTVTGGLQRWDVVVIGAGPRTVRRTRGGRAAVGARPRRKTAHRRRWSADRRQAQPLSPHRPRPDRARPDRGGAWRRIRVVDEVFPAPRRRRRAPRHR